MGLESATFISGLSATNPVGATDPKSQGDDHLRLIKSTLLNTFPNITGAMNASHTELNNLVGVTGKTGTGNVVLSASPTLSGTLASADITASGTVTGNLFSGSGASLTNLPAGQLTGEIADARLSDNVPLKDAENEFTEDQTISNPTPAYLFKATSAAANAGVWGLVIAGDGEFRISGLDDALATVGNAITGTHDASSITLLNFTADSITANGSEIATEGRNNTFSGANSFSSTPTGPDGGGLLNHANTANNSGTIEVTGTEPTDTTGMDAGDIKLVF